MADVELLASGKMEVTKEHRLAANMVWPCYEEPYSSISRYPASKGDQFTYAQESGSWELQYGALDKDGLMFWRPDGYQEPPRPYSKTFTMPAGTAWVVVSWHYGNGADTPTLVKIGGGCLDEREG